MIKLTNDQLKKFQDIFDLQDLYDMQYALGCRFGTNNETACKLEEYLEDIKY